MILSQPIEKNIQFELEGKQKQAQQKQNSRYQYKKDKNSKGHFYFLSLLFRPHLWGEELHTQMGFFFVQTILADRYINPREM